MELNKISLLINTRIIYFYLIIKWAAGQVT